jgi:hypothetical protein
MNCCFRSRTLLLLSDAAGGGLFVPLPPGCLAPGFEGASPDPDHGDVPEHRPGRPRDILRARWRSPTKGTRRWPDATRRIHRMLPRGVNAIHHGARRVSRYRRPPSRPQAHSAHHRPLRHHSGPLITAAYGEVPAAAVAGASPDALKRSATHSARTSPLRQITRLLRRRTRRKPFVCRRFRGIEIFAQWAHRPATE